MGYVAYESVSCVRVTGVVAGIEIWVRSSERWFSSELERGCASVRLNFAAFPFVRERLCKANRKPDMARSSPTACSSTGRVCAFP